jgi:hypothetical protein
MSAQAGIADATPNHFRVRVSRDERCNQNMKAVGSSASLVMHNVTLIVRGCPNQTFARAFVISDEIGGFPLLSRLCNLSFVVRAKRDNHWWQIPDGTNSRKRVTSCKALRYSGGHLVTSASQKVGVTTRARKQSMKRIIGVEWPIDPKLSDVRRWRGTCHGGAGEGGSSV